MPPPQPSQVPSPGTQTEGKGDQHFTRPTRAVMGAAARAPSWVPRWAQTLRFQAQGKAARKPPAQLAEWTASPGQGSEHPATRGTARARFPLLTPPVPGWDLPGLPLPLAQLPGRATTSTEDRRLCCPFKISESVRSTFFF